MPSSNKCGAMRRTTSWGTTAAEEAAVWAGPATAALERPEAGRALGRTVHPAGGEAEDPSAVELAGAPNSLGRALGNTGVAADLDLACVPGWFSWAAVREENSGVDPWVCWPRPMALEAGGRRVSLLMRLLPRQAGARCLPRRLPHHLGKAVLGTLARASRSSVASLAFFDEHLVALLLPSPPTVLNQKIL